MFRERFPQLKFFRTLRVRLAGIFLLLLAVVLAVVGVVGTATEKTVLENQSNQILADELGALKGYIRFEGGKPYWFVDRGDPEENAAYAQLDDVFVLANELGELDALSAIDPSLSQLGDRQTILKELAQVEKTHEPVVKTLFSSDQVPYQIISSALIDKATGGRWYVAEGRSLADDFAITQRFRRNFLIFLPAALLACAVVSWYSAGRALRALQAVDSAAQKVTGSNLGLQIQRRGADDELDRLIDSFNQMSSRLKASFDQTRQFSTDVSHELRTPLTAIQGQLEVALLTGRTKEQLQEAIENALQDVERLANLVRALLLLSQSESGQLPMNKNVLDLRELVGDLVDQFQIPAEACNLTLTHTTEEQVWCEADRTQIERVVTNLLSNAIKYTPGGGWVKACAELAGSNVRLIVEDSGVGIPADHVAHIFDRFYRVPDPNPEKGLGLGLSFVATIVRAHGGSIQVESEIGKGSRFEVLLPVGTAPGVHETPVLQSEGRG
ncbi:MAG TPA: ATP-binding protein [Bryobacteraceae bacterium]|nr:ATP-binding protein [Bryobacteraceae bacterium]